MPLLSGIVPNIRVAVSSTVGALMFIIPVAPGPLGALGAATITRPRRSSRPRPPARAEHRAVLDRLHGGRDRARPAATSAGPGGRSSRWSPPSHTAGGPAASRCCYRRTPRRSRMPRSTASPAAAPGTAWRSATTSTAGPAICRPSSPSSPTGDGRARSRHACRRTPPPPRRPSSRRSPAPATDPATRWAAIRTRPATRRPWWWPSRRPGPGARPPRSRRRRTRPPTRTP